MKEKRRMPRHWYLIWRHECPICGCGTGGRERQYGEPPDDPAKRYDYDPTHYDGCLG